MRYTIEISLIRIKRYLVQTVTEKDTATGNTTTVKASRIAASGDCSITLPDDENDMTNCPDSILLNAVGRELGGRARFPQVEWFNNYP